MKKEEVNSEINENVETEVTAAETIAETEEVVDATPVEATKSEEATEVVTENTDAPLETVTSEEFDEENQPVVAQKKKFKMKPWQIALTAVGAVLLIVIIVALSILLPLIIRKPVLNPQSSEITGYYRVDTYIGTTSYLGKDTTEKGKTIELGDLFKDATAMDPKDTNIISISGTTITVNAVGTAKVDVTIDGEIFKDQSIIVVDGVNVFDYAQLKAVSADESVKNIILQSDIDFTTKAQGGGTIELKANLYGNTHKVDGTNYTKDYEKFNANNYKNSWTSDVMFEVAANDIEINGVHARGKDLKKGEDENGNPETWQHDEYSDGGDIIDIYDKDGIVIKNCVLEKAFKCVWIKESSVTIEGTLMREVGDGCISLETTEKKANKLTLKNNTIISPQVAGVIIYNLGNLNPIPADITIEGFFDVYNWKNNATAKLMPITEGILATIVNNLIGTELKKSDYHSMMVEDTDGDYWLHIAIVVLSSGINKDEPSHIGLNEPKINGTVMKSGNTKETITGVSGNDNYVKRELPFGTFAEALNGFGIRTANMIGYEIMPTVKNMQPVNPNLVEINKDMFDKMYGVTSNN